MFLNLAHFHKWCKQQQIRILCATQSGRLLLSLDKPAGMRQTVVARACGVWTYESRQGRKAATAVCFAIAAVTLAPSHLRFAIYDCRFKMFIAIAIGA
jgi:hypothetical protein